MLTNCIRVSIPSGKTVSASWNIPSSKSDLNRFFILAACLKGESKIHGQSTADDVLNMISCLKELGVEIETTSSYWIVKSPGLKGLQQEALPKELRAGAGGTTVRFLMALLSALPVRHRLLCHEQILRRPHHAWVKSLESLGAKIEVDEHGFFIHGVQVWPKDVHIEVTKSSQFISALCMVAAFQCDALSVHTDGEMISKPYWDMTIETLRELGATIEEENSRVVLKTGQMLKKQFHDFYAEGDASSSAIWLAAQKLGHSFSILNYPKSKRQADTAFVGILKQLDREKKTTIDLSHCPDLAPVLAAYSALRDGEVTIVGAAHLRHKESNRIEDLVQMFAGVGVHIRATLDGMHIVGNQLPTNGVCDPQKDHRLVMAAVLLCSKGAKIDILDSHSIEKSYPEFWADVERVGWQIQKV